MEDPRVEQRSVYESSKIILSWFIFMILWLPISLAFLPLFIAGLVVWGLPPIISPLSRSCKYLIAAWTEGTQEYQVIFSNRLLIFLIVIHDGIIKAPVNGVFWFIDELLYPAYHKVKIERPIFYVTTPRSGSSQTVSYLEDDVDNFIVPMVIEGFFPYIWMWRLIVPILKLFGLRKESFESDTSGLESFKRHNFDKFRTESLDIITSAWHFTRLSYYLGNSFVKWGMPFTKLTQPVDDTFCKSFVQFNDCIMKKTMYHRGKPGQRPLIKGHFLVVAKVLEDKYPGAKFFATARDPLETMRSLINFMVAISVDGPPSKVYSLQRPPWNLYRDFVVDMLKCYYKEQMVFYGNSQELADSSNKMVLSFTSYLSDPSGTLKKIYEHCGIPVPDRVTSTAIATAHNNCSKQRETYDPSLNRTLASLGVDEAKLREELAEYTEWIKNLDKVNTED